MTIIKDILDIVEYIVEKYKNLKQIKLINGGVFNLNSNTGELEQVSHEKGYDLVDNLFLNRIIAEATREIPFSINAISLENIQLVEDLRSDIRFDGGFINDSQYLILIAYNNGNHSDYAKDITLELQALKRGTSTDFTTITTKKIICKESINPGIIRRIYRENIQECSRFFNENEEYDRLRFQFKTNEIDNETLSYILSYSHEENKFTANGFGSNGTEVQRYYLFDLRAYKKSDIIYFPHTIKQGITNIDFVVLVDKSNYLTYEVAVWKGNKKIKLDNEIKVHITVPKYKQVHSKLFGDMFGLIYKQNQDLENIEYDFGYIQSTRPEIVYNTEEVANKFSKTKFKKS